METLPDRLRKEILDIQRVLTQSTFFIFTSEEKEAFLEASLNIQNRLNILSEQVLVTGLLGGTGVGKSMLMNALAGAEISSTSHRRPHTDHVIIYRHEQVERPSFLGRTSVPWHEIVHQASPIRQIILCDLPDYDSLVGEHRDRVTGFLDLLDILVWVTSPEKYADHRFYSFLKSVPKAKPNFYFILNKADLLFQGEELEPAYQKLSSLLNLFLQYLQKCEIQEPLLYAISAQQAFQNSSYTPWNQFPGFRKEIFRQRDVKEITAIKAANLDQEIKQLHSRLQKQVLYLDSLRHLLDGFIDYYDMEKVEWQKTGWNILDTWIEVEMRTAITAHLEDLTHLAGPGYWIARTIKEWENWRGSKKDEEGPSLPVEGRDPPGALRDQLERLENRLIHQCLQHSMPKPLRDQLLEVLDFKKEWEDFAFEWKRKIAEHFLISKRPLLLGFRTYQYAMYLALFFLLLVALTGREAGQEFLQQPGWLSFLNLAFSILQRLFSITGLGALLSYLLLQGFLGARFYKRYRSHLRKRVQKFTRALEKDLMRIWVKHLDRFHESLEGCKKELESEMRMFKNLMD